MTPQEVLAAAKSGNPQAIAALINRTLKPKSMTAKAKLTDGCLHVMVEGVTVPERGAIVPYITKGVRGLGIRGVNSLIVCGKVAGEDVPAWSDRLELKKVNSTPVETDPVSTPDKESIKDRLSRKGKEPWTFSHWAGLAFLVVLIIWLFHGCTYPHNCQEARENLAKSEKELDTYFEKAASGSATDNDIRGAMYAKGLAEGKVSDKCYKH